MKFPKVNLNIEFGHFERATRNVTCSFGITEYYREFESLLDAINTADEYLYHAKHIGKNTIVSKDLIIK